MFIKEDNVFFPFINIFRRNVLNNDSMFQTRLHDDKKAVQ